MSTESGRWKREASLDDRFFGEYLSSLKEVTGELPEKVVFRDSVADVIEEEWEVALWLTMWIDNTEANYDMSDTTDLLMFIPAFVRLVPLSPYWDEDYWGSQLPNVFLKDVLRISNIITLPKNWRMYVKVGDGVSEKDVVDHILAAGQEVVEAHGGDFTFSREALSKTMEGSVIYYISYIRDEEENEEYTSDLMLILSTLARDAAMTKLDKDRYATAITPLDLRWDLALGCMERLGIAKDTLAWNTALTFTGRANPEGYTVTPVLEIELSEFGEVHLLEGNQRGLTSSMYSLLLPQLSDELLLASFPFINEAYYVVNEIDAYSGEYCNNALLKLSLWIHNVIGAQLSSYNLNMADPSLDLEGFKIEQPDYRTYIYLLDHFIAGRVVLDRLAKMKSGHSDEMANFISEVRDYVATHRASEVSLLFPTPSDIARAKLASTR